MSMTLHSFRSWGLALASAALPSVWTHALVAQEASPARTSKDPFGIGWEAPSECPDAARGQAQTEAALGDDPASLARAQDAAFHGVARFEGNRWTLHITMRLAGASSDKHIEAATCQELVDAYALIVTYVLDPSLATGEGLPRAAREPRPTSPPKPAAPVAKPARSSSAVPFAIGPVVAAGVGFLPSPSFGLGAALTFGSSLRWQLRGMFWPDREARTAVQSLGGARIRLLSVQPSVCMPVAHAIGVCAASEVGAMRAEGIDVAHGDEGTSWWLAFVAGVTADVARTCFVDLRARFDIGIPIFRPRFVLEHVDDTPGVEVFRPAPVFGILSLEVAFHGSSTESATAGHQPVP